MSPIRMGGFSIDKRTVHCVAPHANHVLISSINWSPQGVAVHFNTSNTYKFNGLGGGCCLATVHDIIVKPTV